MHRNKLTTEGGFRLIRAFTVAHNARRLRTYVERLSRRSRADPLMKRIRLRNRRQRRALP